MWHMSVGLSTHHAFCSYELQGKDVIFAGDDEGNIHMYVSCEVAREIAPFGSGSAHQHRWSLPGCDLNRATDRADIAKRSACKHLHARAGGRASRCSYECFQERLKIYKIAAHTDWVTKLRFVVDLQAR